MRQLRVAPCRQLALDLGEVSGQDRWDLLPEQARLRVLALLAGVPAGLVAEVTGLTADQVAARWASWADAQVRLRERTGTGMTPEEYQRAAAVITACGGALPDGAVPADQPALPGKRK